MTEATMDEEAPPGLPGSAFGFLTIGGECEVVVGLRDLDNAPKVGGSAGHHTDVRGPAAQPKSGTVLSRPTGVAIPKVTSGVPY